MHFYKRWNNITGWAVFAVAAMVYLMTMEPVSSLWTARSSSRRPTNSKWDTRPEPRCS